MSSEVREEVEGRQRYRRKKKKKRSNRKRSRSKLPTSLCKPIWFSGHRKEGGFVAKNWQSRDGHVLEDAVREKERRAGIKAEKSTRERATYTGGVFIKIPHD